MSMLIICMFFFSLSYSAQSLSAPDRGTLLITMPNNKNLSSDRSSWKGNVPGDLALYNLATGAIELLVASNDSVQPFSPCFSPDGKRVAYYAKKRNKIRIIDIHTKQIIAVGPDTTPRVPLSWADSCIYTRWSWGTSLLSLNVYNDRIDTVYTFKIDFNTQNTKDILGIGAYGNVSADGRSGCYSLDHGFYNSSVFKLDPSAKENKFPETPFCQAAMSPSGNLAVATGHSNDRIKRLFVQDDSLFAPTVRTIYGHSYWFNKWSYNSEYDMTFHNNRDTTSWHLDVLTGRTTKLLSGGFCIWGYDTRGWLMDTLNPATPSNLTAVANGTKVTLSWNAPTSAPIPSLYKIKRDGIVIAYTKNTFFADSLLAELTSYVYEVISKTDGVGESSPEVRSITTQADILPPKGIVAISYGDSIQVVFSEPVDSVFAVQPSNYALPASITVSAIHLRNAKTVILKTNSFASATDSFVVISNVRDKAASSNLIVADTVPLIIVRDLVSSSGRQLRIAGIDTLKAFNYDNTNSVMYSCPLDFMNMPYISTSYRDTIGSDQNHITFSVNRAVNVSVIQYRHRKKSDWLEDNLWIPTGEYFGDWDVYRKKYEAGTIVLNGCGSGSDPYIVTILPCGYGVDVTGKIESSLPRLSALSILASPMPFSGSVSIIINQWHKDLTVDIVDVKGCLVARLDNGLHNRTGYEFVWNGKNSKGTPVTSGIYLCRAYTADGKSMVKKLNLIR